MAEISIRLSSFSDFTAVNVEGLGVIKVKKESSNQALRRSEILRDIFALQDEAKRLDDEQKKLMSEGKTENDPEIIKLEHKATSKLDKVTELQKMNQQLAKARLSDDEDGKLVEKLYDNASDEDIARLLALEVDPSGEEHES